MPDSPLLEHEQIERLRAALKPFVEAGRVIVAAEGMKDFTRPEITRDHFRAAIAAFDN